MTSYTAEVCVTVIILLNLIIADGSSLKTAKMLDWLELDIYGFDVWLKVFWTTTELIHWIRTNKCCNRKALSQWLFCELFKVIIIIIIIIIIICSNV